MSVFAILRSMIEAGGRAALVSVVEVSGSSPRDVGARMAVRADGAFSGTIGGGALEWQALAEAQALLAADGGARLRRLDRSLGPDLGQCCGGRVRLTIERFDASDLDGIAALADVRDEAFVTFGLSEAGGRLARRLATDEEAAALAPTEQRRVLPDGRVLERFGAPATAVALFGAGHVGRALALALAPLPFRLVWADARQGAFPAHVPRNVVPVAAEDPVSLLRDQPDGAIVLIMTHSHALDLAIATAALAARRFALVGVIGSATKRARFASQMRQAGLESGLIDTLACPIGLPGIEGKEPAVIAASVAAQMLMVREAARARLPVFSRLAEHR